MVTIEEIEGCRWPEPEADTTYLVRRCHELRRKPLADFTVEDMRIMLGQEIAVPVLLPMAVDVLVCEPLAEGDFYPGDLLAAVLRLPTSAWSGLEAQRERLAAALATLPSRLAREIEVAEAGEDEPLAHAALLRQLRSMVDAFLTTDPAARER